MAICVSIFLQGCKLVHTIYIGANATRAKKEWNIKKKQNALAGYGPFVDGESR